MNRLPRLTQTDLHLTDEQLCAQLCAELDCAATPPAHLAACAECQSELAGLRASFGHLRAATTNLAVAAAPRLCVGREQATAPSQLRRHIWAASLATAAALFTISASFFHLHRAPAVMQAAAPEVAPNVSDDALLDGIQADLSTSIPPSLEPLQVPSATY